MRRNTTLILITIVGILALASLPFLPDRQPTVAPYTVDRFRSVDPAQISHRETEGINPGVQTPSALAIMGGNLVVAGQSEIAILSAQGAPLHTHALPAPATCLAIGNNGSIHVGLGDRILTFSRALTNPEASISLGENATITSMAISRDAMFVCDAGQRRLWHYTPDGRLKQMLEAPVNDPTNTFVMPSASFDAAARRDGNGFWVINPGRLKVMHIDATGHLIAQWGRSAQTIMGFCGCCNPSQIALLKNGSVVTAEKHLPRIKIFDEAGTMISVVAKPDDFSGAAPIIDLAVDEKDRILVLDAVQQQIRIFEISPDCEQAALLTND